MSGRVRLAADARGSTLVEFAIVLPIVLVLMMGLGELTYQGYMKSVFVGALQKAGRDSTIQGNSSTTKINAIDAGVMAQVNAVNRAASLIASSRLAYGKFGNIKPEYFYDNNNNGTYDKATECFTDVNGNKTWDADPGVTGQGGANDVVVYQMIIRYPRLFPMAKMLGWSDTVSITARTILKNQPYASQSVYTETKVCP